MSIAFLVLADKAELPLLLLPPRLLLVLLLLRLTLVVLLLVRPRMVRLPLLFVLLRLIVEEEDFRGISRLAQHNI